MVVYGHTPVPEPEWLNRTINIDTGCVFGGKLTALRYPERSWSRSRRSAPLPSPVRPFLPRSSGRAGAHGAAGARRRARHRGRAGQADHPTRLRAQRDDPRGERDRAALEVMSRFAANPKWLIYLPPTMSPVGDEREPGLLEHPAEAFAYYRAAGRPAGRLRGEAHGRSLETDWVLSRLRADAVVGEGAGAAVDSSTPRRWPAARRPGRNCRRPGGGGARGVEWTRSIPVTGTVPTIAASSTPTVATAGRSSRCDVLARAVPPARDRRCSARRQGPRLAHGGAHRARARPTDGLLYQVSGPSTDRLGQRRQPEPAGGEN